MHQGRDGTPDLLAPVCPCKTWGRGKVVSKLMFLIYRMLTVSPGGADKYKAKGTTRCLGTDSHADSRHGEHNLGLCEEVTALNPTRVAWGKHRQG